MGRCGWCWNSASTTTDESPCRFCGRIYRWELRGPSPHIVEVDAAGAVEDPGGGGGGVTVPDPSGAPDGQTVQTLTGAYVLGSPGGVQTVSLLGPFHVTVASASFNDTGTLAEGGSVQAAALPDGALVVKAWAEPTVAFDAGVLELVLWLGNAAAIDQLSRWTVNQVFSSVPTVFRMAMENPVSPSQPVGRSIAGCSLVVTTDNMGIPTVGEADIYALIATPA